MEFQEVCKNFKRMCDSLGCSECGIEKARKTKKEFSSCESFLIDCPEQAEQIVEQWAKENPVVTNGDKFREVFGFDIVMVSGLLNDEWLNQEYKESR
jgi:hypothetical protein